MSGYFVHGGTQYAYSQNTPQTAATGQTGYQQPAQTTQFYQSTAYPAPAQQQQATRTLAQTNKNTVGTGSLYGGSSYATQNLNQGYTAAATQQRIGTTTPNQAYSSYDATNFGRHTSTSNDTYGRNTTNYNTTTGVTGYGGYGSNVKQEENKYSSGNTYGGYKTTNNSYGSLGLTGGSLNSSGSSYFTQPSQPTNYSTSYPSQATYKKTEEASASQYSYEKALYVAANQYYMNKKAETTRGRGGSGGGMSGTGGGGRGRGGHRGRGGGRGGGGGGGGSSQYNQQSQSTGPKIIKATEVKAYLYAWCGQRRLKPEYTIEPIGMPPRMKFCCTLKITGLDYIAKVTAASKKDSQSKAAWDFCEHLVKTGYMKEAELPDKPVDPAPKSSVPPKPAATAGTEPPVVAESVEDSGGWTLENCRQRLNQFTQRWRIPAEFKHETHGPEHARTFVAELAIIVKWLDNKEFVAKERGNNKKQATAVCALAMIRQLFKESLIEKHGDPFKNPRRSAVKDSEKKEQVSTAGTKRKADESNGNEEIDEYGNWKLEDGRQRLHMFCQATNQVFDIKYVPDGNTPPRTFTATVEIDATVDSELKHLKTTHTCAGKKQAAQHCALLMIKELYNLSLVEANVGIQQSKKKNPRQRNHPEIEGLMESPFGGPMFRPGAMFGGPFSGPPPPQRRTPYEDAIIFEKHRRIYPTEFELNMIQKTVRTIEGALKQVSDQLTEPDVKIEPTEEPAATTVKKEPETTENGDKDKDVKRVLQGVMRVGSLAKGLLLRGDLSAQLVLLAVEIPTAAVLTKISCILSKVLEETGDKYLVELRIQECAVNIISPYESNDKEESVRCTVKVSLTSPLMRSPEPTTGPADMLDRDKCLKSLAELRHAKWFQACASGLHSCVVLIRIFKDMRKRISTWAPLSDWALELIIEKSLRTSLFGQLTVGEGLRRALSCVSSGILLEVERGIHDPCEKTPTDVIEHLTPQEREDVTESAHHALRMLVYRQTHKVLGIEPLPPRVRKSTEGESSNMEL